MTRKLPVIVAALAIIAPLACQPQAGDPLADGLFSSASPFNTPIPADATVDPGSAAMVNSMVSDGNANGRVIAWTRWSAPLYYADSSTPRYSVEFDRFHFGGMDRLHSVPIPDGALPADPQPPSSTDGHMTVMDVDSGCMYDLFEAHKDGSTWYAGWANRQWEHDDGTYHEGVSSRGSGFANLAGLIFPDELGAGQSINHALMFSTGVNRRERDASGNLLVRAPATESDGALTGSQYVPEGARVRLPASFEPSDLTGWSSMNAATKQAWTNIVEALKVYGAYDGDNSGGGFNLYALDNTAPGSETGGGSYPWSTNYPSVPASLVSSLEVLTLPPATVANPAPIVEHGCGDYEG